LWDISTGLFGLVQLLVIQSEEKTPDVTSGLELVDYEPKMVPATIASRQVMLDLETIPTLGCSYFLETTVYSD